MILTAEWALQTALTAAIGAASGYGATRLAVNVFNVGKKAERQKEPSTCPLEGCLTCSARHKTKTP